MHSMFLQFDMLENNLVITKQLITSINDATVFQKRDVGEGWTISEVLGHLVDYELLIHERSKLTIENDRPKLPAMTPDPDTLVIEHDFANQSAQDVLSQWQTNRDTYLTYLKSLPDEPEMWQRSGLHAKRGEVSLRQQLFITSWHDTNHIRQIINIINS